MILLDGIIYKLQSNGGISTYFTELLKELSLNENVTLLHYGKYPCELNNYNINFVELKWRFLERLRQPNYHFDEINFISSYYRIFNPKKVLNFVIIHDFIPEKRRVGIKWIVGSFQKFLAAKFAVGVVCISNHTRHDLRQYYGYKVYQKSRTIYNGKADHFRQHEEVTRNAKCLVYVGSRSEYKNFDLVVRLGAVLKDYNLTIVGGKNLSSVESDGLEAAWGRRWKYSGIVSNEELSVIYSTSAVLLYPSSEEGFGLPIIEAFSCGCAVVIAATAACIEISGGHAKVTSPNILTFARKVIISSELNEEKRAKLIKYAEQFSWRSTATEIEAFIAEKELELQNNAI